MKRMMSFVVSYLNALLSDRWLTAFGVALILVASVGSAKSQSRDRANPTRLTSTEISGVIGDNPGDVYYYTFVAGPGEVVLTFTLQGERGLGAMNHIAFALFNEDGRRISTTSATAMLGRQEQKVARVSFSRRQRVLLSIGISEHQNGSAKYWLRLSGPVDVSQDAPSKEKSVGEEFQESLNRHAEGSGKQSQGTECLPKQGTLIVKMKDGSKQIIDLSKAETVTIVP